jgi:predicted anti-sigma-YlaC factor YlaD
MGTLPRDCDRARLAASLALDGEGSELELARLRAHLAGCEPCRASVRTTGRLAELVRSAPAEESRRPAFFTGRERRPHVRRWQLVASAAAVLAALAAGSLAGTLSGPGRPAAPAPASMHRLLIEQSLLALGAVSQRRATSGGRTIAS